MTPRIFTRSESGLTPAANPGKWGRMPAPYALTVHHSAGPRARTHEQAKGLHRAYQRSHEAKGWGDIGYHFSMDDLGRFYRLREQEYVGTHVGGHNTGNLGLMLHGNYELDRLTLAQKESLEWLFRGGFYALMGVPERQLQLVRGHREWPGHRSNACPGKQLMEYLGWLRNAEDY